MAMPTKPSDVVCEIRCASRSHAQALAQIAGDCARDIGQPVALRLMVDHVDQPTLTLHLPVELAAAQHPVWCLACRLACFCPGSRVSVLILGEASFAPPSSGSRRTCIA